jgi:polyhydroxyalkanoate synthase
MFTVSWRNPTEEHWNWGVDTYVDALIEAMHAVCEITGSAQVNTVSLCAGGITTAALLGHLASSQDDLVNCATFAVTLLDFSVLTMFGLFATPSIIRGALRSSKRSGVIQGRDATTLFALLRPNDLIWNYWVSSNLIGEEQPTFDVSPGTPIRRDFLPPFMPTSST